MPNKNTSAFTLIVALGAAMLGGMLGWGGTVMQFQADMVTRAEAEEIARGVQVYPEDRKFLLEATKRHAENIEELRRDFNRLVERLAEK